MNRLGEKVVLITGAGSQIGFAFAKLALEEGAKAVILAGIDRTKGHEQAVLLGKNGHFQHLDVRQASDWQKLVGFISREYGQLNVLVNNAGISGTRLNPPAKGLDENQLRSWQAVFQTNLESIFLGCSIAIELMQKTAGGAIVNVGSRSGLVGRPYRMAYAASKSAAINLNQSVALYCAENQLDIRCNIVLPSTILTEMWNPVLGTPPDIDEALYSKICRRIPLRRFGKPEEVAKAILFLASDEASYITGTQILVDGGAQAQDVLRMHIE